MAKRAWQSHWYMIVEHLVPEPWPLIWSWSPSLFKEDFPLDFGMSLLGLFSHKNISQCGYRCWMRRSVPVHPKEDEVSWLVCTYLWPNNICNHASVPCDYIVTWLKIARVIQSPYRSRHSHCAVTLTWIIPGTSHFHWFKVIYVTIIHLLFCKLVFTIHSSKNLEILTVFGVFFVFLLNA